MTPPFTTPCYVRVEDKDKRNEVCDKLELMGYTMSDFDKKHLDKTPEFFQVSTSVKKKQIHVTSDLSSVHKVVGRIDCGTNIPLFLTLAGMRSDTNKGQWHIAQANIMFKKLKGEVVTASKKRYISFGEMFMPLNQNLCFTWFSGNPKQLFRRATAIEIVEYFKKKGE